MQAEDRISDAALFYAELRENDMEENELEVIDPEEEEDTVEEYGSNSSWKVSALVGVLMLAVGLVLGYLGRGQFGPEMRSAKATEAAQAAVVETQAAGNAEMMEFLKKNTRHFRGDANAPVTIIEFSDYQ